MGSVFGFSFSSPAAESDLPAAVWARLDEGLAMCREEQWQSGLAVLGALLESEHRSALPGIFYSTLGYGLARFEKRYRDGIKLCEHGVKRQFYEAENYYNLARARLLLDDRSRAVRVLQKGLRMDPRHAGLLRLRRELGVRKQPVLRFLSRSNPLNRALGRLRALMAG